ncbi:MAG: beta-ketoacyl synthase N-terminal-like domain-containing protein [Planctomycetota bacterium]|jgi:3-oxoacyl-[acyl-carrier-protein] synthase-3
MADSGQRVRICGTGSFLPNEPVSNDRIDEVLGPIDEAPLAVRKFMRTVARRLLKQGGVTSRHFAVDPETRQLTHCVAALGEEAARGALEAGDRSPRDVQLLLLTSPNYDRMTPPTSTLLQERLGIESCAEMEIHSNCSGIGKCMQIAYDALRVGRYDTALVVGVQHSSAMLRGRYFNQAKLSREQAAMRYVLSDGAGAVLLEREAAGDGAPNGHELLGTFVESVGGDRNPGMTAGAGVADAVQFDRPAVDVYESGSHHLAQDFVAILRDAGDVFLQSLVRMGEALGIRPEDVDHCVWSIPSKHLYDENRDRFLEVFGGLEDRVRFRGADVGYCGGASLMVHLDRMARSGELQEGQLVILHALESSKWMTGGFAVRW